MNVVIFGASGYTGKEILKQALDVGHSVTAFTRDSKSITIKHPNLNVVEGYVLNRQHVHQVLLGHDAVIQCLGIGGKGYGQPNSFVSDASKIIVKEMEATHVSRLVAMSNAGAGNSWSFQSKVFTKILLPYFMKWLKVIIDDKNIMEPNIMNSSLKWTIVRSPNITNKISKGKVVASLDGTGLGWSITNEDNANFIVKQLLSNEFINQAPCISN